MKYAWLVLILTFNATLFSQDAKPEAKPAPAPAPKWDHSTAAGFTLTQGNSETLTFTASHNSEWKNDNSKFTIGINGGYGVKTVEVAGEEKNDEFIKNVSFNTQYNHKLYKKLFWFIGQNSEIDKIADLEYRVNIGPGLGYKFLDDKKFNLEGELGINYIREKYEDIDAEDKAAGRVGEKFGWNISETSKLWLKSELLMNLEESKDFRTNTEFGLEVKINKYFNIRSTVQHKYNNEPPANIEKDDFIFITSLVFKY